jgi:hypothetical protein
MASLLIGCGGQGAASTHPTAKPTSSTESPSSISTLSPVSSAAAVPPPSPSPVPLGTLPLGIFIKDFLVEGGPAYSISLVGLDGRVAATAGGAKRSNPGGALIQWPNVSASNSRLYYLDGDSKVMFLRPDGSKGSATTLPVGSESAAVFSVSPDDSRIAVAIITFPYPAKTRIYVEDISGGGHHIELFSSSTVLEYPLGWHQGHLVIGVGLNVPPQNAYEGFAYAYRGYHVADATTGARVATVCDGYDSSGPPVPAGTVCVNYPNYEVSDWNGSTRASPAGGCGGGVLSPDGSLIATCQGLVARDGATRTAPFAGSPQGWMDNTHVVVNNDTNTSLGIVDISSLGVTPSPALGFFAGTIPGGL